MIKRETYDLSETATILGLGKSTAWNHVKSGVIPSIAIGGKILIPRAYVDGLFAGAGYPLREESTSNA